MFKDHVVEQLPTSRSDEMVKLGVSYEFRQVEPSLLDHSIVSDVFESVLGLFVVKTMVHGWWWCGRRVWLNGWFSFGAGFGFLSLLGFAFVACINNG